MKRIFITNRKELESGWNGLKLQVIEKQKAELLISE